MFCPKESQDSRETLSRGFLRYSAELNNAEDSVTRFPDRRTPHHAMRIAILGKERIRNADFDVHRL